MAFFAWQDELSVGHRFIDKDHQRLIQLINELHEAMAQGRGKAALAKTLGDLILYTKEHFAREEAEMTRIRYSAAPAHREEHAKLVREVLALQKQFNEGGALSAVRVSGFLKTWLVDHIQTSDKAFGVAIKQAQAA